MGIFSFRKNKRVPDLGQGVGYLGFERPRPIPAEGYYNPAYMVRGQLVTQAPGAVKMGQTVVPVSLLGNGLSYQGQVLLSPLAREEG